MYFGFQDLHFEVGGCDFYPWGPKVAFNSDVQPWQRSERFEACQLIKIAASPMITSLSPEILGSSANGVIDNSTQFSDANQRSRYFGALRDTQKNSS